MEQFRRAWANIQEGVGRLGPTHKLLFGSLAVIAVMTLFLVSQYAAKPAMVDLMAQGTDTQLVSTLRASGIQAEVQDGRVVVPAGMQHAAVAHLMSAGQLPDDTTVLFNNLIQSQDWKASREQHRQQAVIALQNELARVIGKIRGVRDATVIIDDPQPTGLGRAVREPSAAVTVFTSGGVPLSQQGVDAIANLVAGSRAGMSASRVQIIDGSTGRPRQVSDEESISSGMYMDRKRQVEQHTQREIERLLSFMPGVVVTVNAAVDITRVSQSEQRYLDSNDGTVSLPSMQEVTEDTSTQGSRGAEPGLRSVSSADISVGRATTGQESSKTSDKTNYDNMVGSRTTQRIDPRGMPTFLSASVVVPQGFIEESVLRTRAEDQADEPVSQAELDAYFETLRGTLSKMILTQLATPDDDGAMREGKVELAMAPLPYGALTTVGGAGGGVMGVSGGGGGGMFSASSMIETVVLGALSLVALAMMLMLVRKAGKRPDFPTAEELVGVPPALEIAGDMVGEADETEAAMAGIEVSEEEVALDKMREQVAEMISSSPENAANLIGRWIGEED